MTTQHNHWRSSCEGRLTDYFPRLAERHYDEVPCSTRNPFTRDRDRIIHTKAFRRLQHKTQAFVEHEGDHYRTRLTHSLEVAQIARSISRDLHLDQDLTEALALAHDLGHPPFGHAGERALQKVMADRGGFDHNYEGLRIVTFLEKRYPDFDGLNLTFATLEGLVKHNGVLCEPKMADLRSFVGSAPFDHSGHWPYTAEMAAFPEAAVAAIADDIAYNVHDLDDGLRSGLMVWDDLKRFPIVGDIALEIDRSYPSLDKSRCFSELHRRLLTYLIADVVTVAESSMQQVTDTKDKACYAIAFSTEVEEAVKCLKAGLFELIYRAEPIAVLTRRAEDLTEDLFARLDADPSLLPENWYFAWRHAGDQASRVMCDFMAGMTDRYALKFYETLGGTIPTLTLRA